jgi:histidinol-phosphate/aromatic aminotransferase/cobyric acid decarboxylase-like protein
LPVICDVSLLSVFYHVFNFLHLWRLNKYINIGSYINTYNNVLIKCLAGGHPLLENCLRFTIGTENENGVLLEALKDIL